MFNKKALHYNMQKLFHTTKHFPKIFASKKSYPYEKYFFLYATILTTPKTPYQNSPFLDTLLFHPLNCESFVGLSTFVM